MAAALGALEDELARPGLQELPQQAGRGHVQEGADAVLLQALGLRRPAAGDDGAGRPDLADHLELRGPELLGREPEDADAPWSLAESRGRLREQATRLLGVGQAPAR